MTDNNLSLPERVDRIRSRLNEACRRAGRDPDSVRLMAVSKTRSPEEVEILSQCGIDLFGENRVQEASAKIPLCPSRLHWHLIGHLQSNKVRAAARLFECIHSVDSPSLLARLNSAAEEEGVQMPVFLEVNVSGESSKFGLAPDRVSDVVRAASGWTRIDLRGLMTIPPFCEDTERTRGHFRALRLLRDRVQAETGAVLSELSMGMSGDFEIAVEEGSTLVRIGTDLFGPRSGKGSWARTGEGEAVE
ncbi:MAG: YggS family pyridoxal phosphate-dependent enzyme [Kiritimatiellia bacterium]|nr:YggS family pyridoxal phosphate-dependent enzyme [Kiritimatiellia bacterium]